MNCAWPNSSGRFVSDAQRELARRAAEDTRKAAKAPRPDPRRFTDLTPFHGMDPRKVLLALGCHPEDVWLGRPALLEELSGENDRRLQGAARCEAGRRSENNLRCKRAALPGESWCRPHHPSAPARAGQPATPGEERQRRLSREALWQRPDGRVLEALYALTDTVQALVDAHQETLDRSRRLERAAVDHARGGWLDADDAAIYTRRSRSAVMRAASDGSLSGVRSSSSKGSWSFRAKDLDAWLELGRTGVEAAPHSGRRTRQR